MFCPFHFKSFQVIFAIFQDTLPPVVRKLVNNNFDPSHQQPQPGLGWAGLGWDIHGKPNFTRRCESAEDHLTVQDTEVQSYWVQTSDCDCEEETGNYNNTVHGDSGLLLLSREGGSKHHPPASIHHTIYTIYTIYPPYYSLYEPVLCGAAAV